MHDYLALLIEFGVPFVLVILLFVAPNTRPMCYSILGAVLPFLFAYLSAFLAYERAGHAALPIPIEQLWKTTLPAYGLAVIVGILLGLVAKPAHSAMRISVASLASIVCVSVFIGMIQ